jgi:hypothetical protein
MRRRPGAESPCEQVRAIPLTRRGLVRALPQLLQLPHRRRPVADPRRHYVPCPWQAQSPSTRAPPRCGACWGGTARRRTTPTWRRPLGRPRSPRTARPAAVRRPARASLAVSTAAAGHPEAAAWLAPALPRTCQPRLPCPPACRQGGCEPFWADDVSGLGGEPVWDVVLAAVSARAVRAVAAHAARPD